MYDLLIKGGRVIDPAQNIDDVLDVAISGNRVGRVASDIPASQSLKTVTARGKIVTPGLIDVHCHVYDGIVKNGVAPDAAGVRQGVTTVVDGGSAGQAIFGGFPRYVIPKAHTTIFCFLHLGSQGLSIMPELRDRNEIDLDATAATIAAHRDIIKGVKLRLVGNIIASDGVKMVAMAKETAKKFGLPIMIHIGDARKQVSPTLTREFLPLMEKGDILSHVYTAMPGSTLRPDGTVLPELREAGKRGVVLDIAHGRFNFSFEVARRSLAQGIRPTTISTDVNAQSVYGPVFGMSVMMTKMMTLGLELRQIIEMSTINPARAIGEENRIGSLKPGMAADVSILDLLSGKWQLTDSQKEIIEVNNLLTPSLTVKAGKLISAAPVARPPVID